MITEHTECRMKWCYYPGRQENGECDKNCFYNTKHIPTNGDTIRNMTDEQLAHVLFNTPLSTYCQIPSCDLEEDCTKCIITWLGQRSSL